MHVPGLPRRWRGHSQQQRSGSAIRISAGTGSRSSSSAPAPGRSARRTSNHRRPVQSTSDPWSVPVNLGPPRQQLRWARTRGRRSRGRDDDSLLRPGRGPVRRRRLGPPTRRRGTAELNGRSRRTFAGSAAPPIPRSSQYPRSHWSLRSRPPGCSAARARASRPGSESHGAAAGTTSCPPACAWLASGFVRERPSGSVRCRTVRHARPCGTGGCRAFAGHAGRGPAGPRRRPWRREAVGSASRAKGCELDGGRRRRRVSTARATQASPAEGGATDVRRRGGDGSAERIIVAAGGYGWRWRRYGRAARSGFGGGNGGPI